MKFNITILSTFVTLIHFNRYSCTEAFSTAPRRIQNRPSLTTSITLLKATQHHSQHPYNNYHHSNKNRNSFSSKTSRESAVIAEWEPVSNLERRIEEGMNYHHDPFSYESIRQSRKHGRRRMNVGKQMMEDDDITRVHGVFVGYRVTKEERARMKSAHPVD